MTALAPHDSLLIFCTQAIVGGAWRRLVELLEYLDGRGYSCHLIAWTSPEVLALGRLPHVTVHGIEVAGGQENSLRFGWESFRRLRRIELPRGRAVWAGSFVGTSGLGLAVARRIYPIRVFSFLRGVEMERSRLRGEKRASAGPRLRGAAHRALMRFMLRSSDLLITQTEDALAKVEASYGRLARRSALLHNNINAGWIRRGAEEALREAGAPRDPSIFRVCFVGRLNLRVKGIDTLVAVADRLRALPIEFHIVGGGEDAAALAAEVARRGLGERVRLHGELRNPLVVMAGCDLVVVPSRSDAMPNVVLEGLAVGRPVIGSAVEGIRLILEHEELLFPPEDVGRFAGMVERASRGGDYLRRLEELSRSRADRFVFDWGGRFLALLAGATEAAARKAA